MVLGEISDATVATIGGLIGASLATATGAVFVRRKTKAETADIISMAAERLMARYELQVQRLEERVRHAEAQVLRCEHSRHEDRLLMEQLESQVQELQQRLDEQGE